MYTGCCRVLVKAAGSGNFFGARGELGRRNCPVGLELAGLERILILAAYVADGVLLTATGNLRTLSMRVLLVHTGLVYGLDRCRIVVPRFIESPCSCTLLGSEEPLPS